MKSMHNAVRAFAMLASLGVALSTTPASAQVLVWQAWVDYSTTEQGFRNWSYMTYLPGTPDTYVLMVYGTNRFGWPSWHAEAPDDACAIWGDGMHPTGGGLEPARVWESPLKGTVRVRGTAVRPGAGFGDGVCVTIWKNGDLLWDRTIEFDDPVGYSYDLSVTVGPGDWLIFRVDERDDGSYDATAVDPRITVESIDSSGSNSWIEPVLRSESSYVATLDLSLFEAPNLNAAAGRRLAISHSLTVTANLVAAGDFHAAIMELQNTGAHNGWIRESPEKNALIADLVQILYLLGLQ